MRIEKVNPIQVLVFFINVLLTADQKKLKSILLRKSYRIDSGCPTILRILEQYLLPASMEPISIKHSYPLIIPWHLLILVSTTEAINKSVLRHANRNLPRNYPRQVTM